MYLFGRFRFELVRLELVAALGLVEDKQLLSLKLISISVCIRISIYIVGFIVAGFIGGRFRLQLNLKPAASRPANRRRR